MNSLEIVITSKERAEALPQTRPVVPPGQVLVRSLRSLVSPGTELSFFEGTHSALPDPGNLWAKYPFRTGYAVIGEVVEVGTGVVEPRVGARVFHFGYHATWNLLSPEKTWLETPADLSDEQVLLSRLVQISASAVELLRKPPRSAIVIGAGLVGLFAAQTLQARGCARVVVQDVLPARIELARRNGLARAVLGEGAGLASALAALDGEAPDCVIEATGVAALARTALEVVKNRGDVVLLGAPRGEVTLNLYQVMMRKNTAMIGVHEGMNPDRAPAGVTSRQALIEEALTGMRCGKIQTEGLVTAHVPPQDCQEFYEQISRDKAKWVTAVIDWD